MYPTFDEAKADMTPQWWVIDPMDDDSYDIIFAGCLYDAKRLAAECSPEGLALLVCMPIKRIEWLQWYYGDSSFWLKDFVFGHEVRDLYKDVFGDEAPIPC